MPNCRSWARAVSSRIDVILLTLFLAICTQFASAGGLWSEKQPVFFVEAVHGSSMLTSALVAG